jgi:hypothetical protein
MLAAVRSDGSYGIEIVRLDGQKQRARIPSMVTGGPSRGRRESPIPAARCHSCSGMPSDCNVPRIDHPKKYHSEYYFTLWIDSFYVL